jgi:hypothetical protein
MVQYYRKILLHIWVKYHLRQRRHRTNLSENGFIYSAHFNPNNPLERHAGESRHPAIEIDREADKIKVLSYLRRDLLINWIPAFAGMTLFWLNGQFRFKPI